MLKDFDSMKVSEKLIARQCNNHYKIRISPGG